VAPQGAVVDLWVVGIVRYPTDLVPVVTDQDNLFINTSELYLTPAYWQRYGPDIANYRISLAVTLRHGQADLSRLRADLRRLYGNRAAVITEGLASDETTTAGTRRAIRLESAALAGFGLLAALAALLLVGQTLGRQILLEAAESPILRALGMTRGQLVGLALVRAAPVAVAGSVLAVAGAVELSPATPLGVARRAELDPGLAVDLPVLAVGAAGVMAGVLACAVLAGWRAGRAPAGGVGAAEPADSAERRPRVAGALAATGLPPTAVTGTRLALEPGRGRTAVPVRSALTAAAAAVCAMTLAVTFGASLLHLVGDPRAYGVTWDLQVGNFADSQGPEQAARKLASNPYVAAYRGAMSGLGPLVEGRSVPLLSFSPGKGSLGPVVVEGREPTQPDEIALGGTSMRTLGKRIGDMVVVSGVGEQRVRVVGRVVVNMGDGNPTVTAGKGAIAHVDLWRRISPPDASNSPGFFFVRLDPASDRRQAIEQLQRDFPNTVVLPLKQPDSPTWSASATSRTPRRPGGAAGARHRDARAGHLGPAARTRPGHPQDARLRAHPGLPDGGLAGHDLRVTGHPGRRAVGHRGRPLGMAAGGRPARRRFRPSRIARLGTGDRRRRAPRRQPGRRRARLGGRQSPAGRRAALRIDLPSSRPVRLARLA
jgi:hypothetical protein